MTSLTAAGPTWADILAAGEKIRWRVEDLIGPDRPLDFSRPFLPESLARVRPLTFLSPEEMLWANQIRGHGYLYLFGLVEEFILPFVLDHARPRLEGGDHRLRALLAFAAEEAKHIHLFRRFREEFQRTSGREYAVIGPPQAVAQAVLAHDPLAVALVILQIEWMTQRHYLDSVRDDQELDPRFASLLRHHWMEEAQHARIDTLIVRQLAAERSAEGRAAALDGYLAIGGLLDDGLGQQARFDLESLEQASGRRLESGERDRFVAVQHQAMRWTFLGSGMTHRNFLESVGELGVGCRERLELIAGAYC